MWIFDKIFNNKKQNDKHLNTGYDEIQCSDICKDIINLLDLDYDVIPAGTDIGEIYQIFNKELVKSFDNNNSYRPIFVVPSESLFEMLYINLNNDEQEINRKNILENIEKMRTTKLIDGKKYFEKKLQDNEQQVSTLMYSNVEEGDYGIADFMSICEEGTSKTNEIILFRVPVSSPWEVFAYLPFGGWNDCPDTLELMSVAKYWHDKYNAVPVVISADTVEFNNNYKIKDNEEAIELAKEMYLFCNDIVEQGVGTIEDLSKLIMKSSVWYFWWD